MSVIASTSASSLPDQVTAIRGGSLLLGVGGAGQNSAVAAVMDGQLVAFCEQERVSRVRSVGLEPGILPNSALRAVLDRAGKREGDVSTYAVAETGALLPKGIPQRKVEHHRAHAAAAAFTSPFGRGAVLVCDQHATMPVSIWCFDDSELVQYPWPWDGPGFAAVYSEAAGLFGLPSRSEFQLEALARIEGEAGGTEALEKAIAYRDGGLRLDPTWARTLAGLVSEAGGLRQIGRTGALANRFQTVLGDALVELVRDIRRVLPHDQLCLGGGLFFNTYLNTRIVECGAYSRVFVPANPSNTGLAAGAPLALAHESGSTVRRGAADAFLGPMFAPEVMKATLDNCKLTYDYVSEREAIDLTVRALMGGQLVGWFQGPMEWGPRSLGHRSILANPFAPYVSENLNTFLKQRQPYRAYALSVCVEDAPLYFDVPAPSSFMELEYKLLDAARFRHILPAGVRRLRVQTIGEQPALFGQLHRAFGEASGAGVLVNTSFNGFHEPMVCSPRDAVRVFYGGGLDMAVLGGFILRK